MGRRLHTTEEFIEKAKKAHGDMFDYSECVYVNAKTKIKLKCKNGHSITINPANHLTGKYGCPQCYGNKQYTTEEFIEKAKKIHGEYFDYSEVNYVNSVTKITIKCKNGHTFKIAPSSHLSYNSGCHYCASENKKNTFEEFLLKAKKTHGDKFDYSECEYINTFTKIKIICDKGHTFFSTPNNHTSLKSCCPTCANENRKGMKKEYFEGKPTILYYVVFDEEVYKIGLTTRTIKQRFYGQTKGRQIRVIKEWFFEDGADAYTLEQSYKKQFKEFKYITTDYIHGGNQELYYKDVLNLDHTSA